MALSLKSKMPRTVMIACALALGVAGATWLTFASFADTADAQRAVPRSATQAKLSYAPVVRSATPAVVNVFVETRVRGYTSPYRSDPF
ncbi:MAG: hypothetical protein AAFR23_09460, partial [Pseudomonadota bacterium]